MKVLNKFYSSCALSSIGDRLWFFALSMYFVTINENNLLMTALNGFICNLFLILLGAQIGSQIDKYPRLNVVKVSLFIQNSTVALTCVIVVLILLFKEYINGVWNGALLYVLQGVMILLNVISTLSSTATKISIEKDWVIVIAEHVDSVDKPETDEIVVHEQNTDNTRRFKVHLTHINAIVRRIDLTTSVFAPLLAGVIMSFFKVSPSFNGTVVSAIFFAVWNLISYAIEFSILKSVYNDVPKLEKKTKKSNKLNKANFCKPAVNLYKGWSVYMHQGASLLPSLALAVLYLTVLCFDSITLGYAKSQNMSEVLIAVFQGIGSVTGILGTFAFELFHNRFKIFLPSIGIIGSVYQLIFLFCCFVAVWLPGSPFTLANEWFSTHQNYCLDQTSSNQTLLVNITRPKMSTFESYLFESNCNSFVSILVLLSAMALSRFGLWLTDLVINQIIQENVEEKQRGVVGGVQSSLNRIFDLIKFVSVILLSDVSQYGYLVLISVSAVIVAFCLYLVYAIKEIVSHRYSKVPYSDKGPYRKSMIEMKQVGPDEAKTTEQEKPNNLAGHESEGDDDSFDDDINQNSESDKKVGNTAVIA